MLFLRFLHVSEVYHEKLTVSNDVPSLTSLVPNKKAILAYPEPVLKGFPAYFQLIGNVQVQRGRFVNFPST